MTQPPPTPLVQAVSAARPTLMPVEHPDLSAVLTHFCDRARPQAAGIPAEITSMAAPQRLASILWESRLRAFVTYSGGDPAICLTEVTLNGLNFLIRERHYQPWGLVFDRQSVYDAGGGPVWYARPDEPRTGLRSRNGAFSYPPLPPPSPRCRCRRSAWSRCW